MILLLHTSIIFEDATVEIGGSAYIGCTFRRCTIVAGDAPTSLDTCKFESCILRLEFTVHDAETLARLEQMLALFRKALPTDPSGGKEGNGDSR